MATIITFPGTSGLTAPVGSREHSGSEVIVFPRTNIRELRRLWGLPEYGLLVAGPDGRAVGALGEEAAAG